MSCSRPFVCCCVLLATLALVPSGSDAALLYESATTVTTVSGGSAGGVETDTSFYSGVNFQLTEPAHVTAIGGHFYSGAAVGNNQIFGAIVPVASQTSPPASATLSSGVLATTLITLPAAGTSNNVSGAVSLDLTPGWYGMYFGSGKFGASSDFALAIKTTGNNIPVNAGLATTYAIRQPDGAFFGQAPGARYFVEGTVPEPATAAALLAVSGIGGLLRRRRR